MRWLFFTPPFLIVFISYSRASFLPTDKALFFFRTCQLGQPRVFYHSVQLHLLEGPINLSTKHSFSVETFCSKSVTYIVCHRLREYLSPGKEEGNTKKLSLLRKSASLEPKRKIQDVFVLPLTIQREDGSTILYLFLLLVWEFVGVQRLLKCWCHGELCCQFYQWRMLPGWLLSNSENNQC